MEFCKSSRRGETYVSSGERVPEELGISGKLDYLTSSNTMFHTRCRF